MDKALQLRAKMRKHEQPIAFPDTETIVRGTFECWRPLPIQRPDGEDQVEHQAR